ncbi:YqaE/Pmp3 family membrane protein [Henriciella barbarensis]|uniref:YqaE/Pmp3 family membrane protein n=2 Tax=Henriciella TaxID=453849 RepID=A0A399QR06_9PROT|nr:MULTISPECIES: YqaE/Pmp3 family membrane protein [Henriciella]MCH2457889.1 YqaE/Pmp3 family membrane protein [Henriciella sp.]MCZ4298743.1 YqaE/Pmp3 family membrane protein [Henriciella marina]RIJ21270.1 YqaE/Pmp3 family membrane protein [Henriciella barbarensis]
MSLVQILLSIFLPPIAVFLKAGVGLQLIINIVLCFFFWLPAVIHALWISAKGGPEPV